MDSASPPTQSLLSGCNSYSNRSSCSVDKNLNLFLGALIMALILNGLVLLGIGIYVQRIVIGVVIISAVLASTMRVRASYLKP